MEVAIIKLGALGDVIRTTPIAEAIKKKYVNSQITWITKPNALQILRSNPYIKKVVPTPFQINGKFEILYNFDMDAEATNLALNIKAKKKLGFYKEGDYAAAFNIGAEYYLNTFFDDELKKTNKQTYQEMIFKAAELPYNKERPRIYLDEADKEYARNFIKENKINQEMLIGIQIGASSRWPSKSWSVQKIFEFIVKAKEKGYEILILNGPEEKEKLISLSEKLEEKSISIHKNDPQNSIKEFASLINLCKKVICPDTLVLHLSLALEKPTIGLFFCTTPHEVEDYGLLKKVISPLFGDFFPEKQDQYSEELVNSISANEIFLELLK